LTAPPTAAVPFPANQPTDRVGKFPAPDPIPYPSTVEHIERGRTRGPAGSTLFALAEALGVEPNELFAGLGRRHDL